MLWEKKQRQRKRGRHHGTVPAGIRLLLLTLPIVLVGGIVLGLNLIFGW